MASSGEPAWLRARQDADTPPRSPVESSTVATRQAESVVAGYRVIRLLGTGDRATVYLGHSANGSPVALKIFRADTAAASVELDIAVLTSPAAPGLVHVLDVAQLDDGRICLVLERLAGGSLARYLITAPRLSPGEVVTILAPVTVALRALHAAGFAHGGVSQASILFDADGRAVLTGFGAVTRLGDASGERMRLLRTDYERLGLVLETLWDALDATDPHRTSGAALLRQFRAAVKPQENSPGAGRASSATKFAAVLDTLERDLFGWAPAEPLQGFPLADSATALALNAPARVTTPRQADSVRLRYSALARPSFRSDPGDLTGTASERGFAGDFGGGRGGLGSGLDEDIDEGNDVDTGVENGVHLGTGRPLDGAGRRGGALRAGALRRLPGRCGDILRGLPPKARLDRARGTALNSVFGAVVDTVVDSHPLQAVGHALRKRLHGYRRPLLVTALGGTTLLMLALTLLPVSGRAGEDGSAETVGATGPARTAEIPATKAPAPEAANAAGAANTPAGHSSGSSGRDRSADEDQAAIEGDDPVAAVAALLGRRASCLAASSLVCLVEVDQTGSALLALDSYVVRERQEGGSGQDLADYLTYSSSVAERTGDLAVVALTPPPGEEKSQPASVLVVKGEGGWRLREIFD